MNIILDRIESAIAEVAARIGPIIAPIPTAYAIGAAVVIHLRWPLWIGIVAGAAIELLGLAAASTALLLREYNKNRRKSDPIAPFWLAASLSLVYLIVAIGLAALLDVFPELARFAPAIFPFLSLCGVTILALRLDHRRRVVEIERNKAERKAARVAARVAAQNQELGRHEAELKVVPSGNGASTRERARAILATNPSISGSELGRKLGKSERLGRTLKGELLPQISAKSETQDGTIAGNDTDER